MNNNMRWFLPIPILVLLFVAKLSPAQTVVTTIESYVLCPGDSATTTVTVTNLNNVASISLSLLYDSSSVDYNGYFDLNPNLSSGTILTNNTGTAIKIAWFSIAGVSVGNDTLIRFRFLYKKGYGYLNWDTSSTGACQYGNVSGQTMPAYFQSGYLAANGVLIQHPDDDSVSTADTAVFAVQAFGNTLSYKWQENNGSGWVDVFNGLVYSGANGPQLKVITPPLAFNGKQYRCRTQGTCPSPNIFFYSDTAKLEVTPFCLTPVSFAGTDTSIFVYESILLSGQAQNYQSIKWLGGDGSFMPSHTSLTTIYQPGLQDVASGGVIIRLVAYALPPCKNDTSSFVLTILPLPPNDPPYFSSGGAAVDTVFFSTVFGQDSVFCTEIIDPEGDDFQLYLGSMPQHGSIQFVSGSDSCFRYTPDLLWIGPDTFELQVCDLAGGCDTALIILSTDLPVANLPPIVLDNGVPANLIQSALQMNLGGTVCLDLFDPEGYPADIFAVLDGPSHGQVSGLGDGDSCIIYVPDTLFAGTDSLMLSLCDSQGACDSVLLLLDILDMNIPYPPDADPDYFNGTEDQVLVCAVLQNDFDINVNIDTASLEIVTAPMHANYFIDTVNGLIAYYPDPHFWGTDSFSYVICDETQLCDTAWVQISLSPVFDPPQADTFQVFEDIDTTLFVFSNDVFPFQAIDTASLAIVNQPQHGWVYADTLDGNIIYGSTLDWYGQDSFLYRVCDDLGNCGIAKVYLDVLPVNDAPRIITINGQAVTSPNPSIGLGTCSGTPIVSSFTYIDPEGDTAYASHIEAPFSNASVSLLDDTTFSYVPAPGYLGIDYVYITLSDGVDSLVHRIYTSVSFPPFVNAGPNASVCAGESYTNTAISSFYVRSFKWKTYGSGFFLNDTLEHAVYVPSSQDIQAGSVKLEVAAFGFYSCGSHSDQLILSFKPLPEVDLGGDTILCKNYSITLDAGPDYESYSWFDGSSGRYLTIDTSLLHAPGGIAGVTVTDLTGCSNDDQIVISFVDCPGFSDFEVQAELKVFPNPADGYVMIQTDIAGADKLGIMLADMTGRVLLQKEWDLVQYGSGYRLNTSNLKSGIYLLVVNSGNNRLTERIVVWHGF